MGRLMPICEGSFYSLWWMEDSRKFRGKEYFDKLKEKDRAAFDALFLRMAEKGEIKNIEQFRKEAGNIYCFKRYQHRLACFRESRNWMLVYGFRKKSDKDKRLKRNIEIAERIRTGYLDETKKESK
jgi:hypothetical protein